MNPMMAALNGSKLSNLAARIAPMKNMIQAAGNPMMMIQQMPQYSQVQKLIAENGGDAQKAFYALANQMGVDPNEVLNALR